MPDIQENQGQKYAPPYSLRLTFEERQQLKRDAGNMPLSAYIRERLFDTPSPRKRTFRQPVKDEQTLAKLLTELGQSRLSSNLNQLAKASNSGSLPVTPETEQAIHQACEDVERMKEYLVHALGLNNTKGQL